VVCLSFIFHPLHSVEIAEPSVKPKILLKFQMAFHHCSCRIHVLYKNLFLAECLAVLRRYNTVIYLVWNTVRKPFVIWFQWLWVTPNYRFWVVRGYSDFGTQFLRVCEWVKPSASRSPTQQLHHHSTGREIGCEECLWYWSISEQHHIVQRQYYSFFLLFIFI